MEKYTYVGKQPDSRVIETGVPVALEHFFENERNNFRILFREQVSHAVRDSKGIYQKLSSQHGAFERLEELMANHKFTLVSVTREPSEKDEFVCRVQARVPTLPAYNDQLFAGGLPEGSKGYMLVSFYIGVARVHTVLLKRERLIERAINQLLPPGMNWREDQMDSIFATRVVETGIKDEKFDPENVMPTVLQNARFEQRFTYVPVEGKFHAQRYYHAPEGYIYRIVVDGYAALHAGQASN